jgi:hypothetical protein
MSACSRAFLLPAILTGALLLGEGSAHAHEALQLDYEAPRECPPRSSLEQQLRKRVPPAWLEGADTRRFDVRIVREDDGRYLGRLEVQGAGPEAVREIRATTCEAVSTSIAVFIAIALDPTNEPAVSVTPVQISRPPSTRPPAPIAAAPRPSFVWSSGVDAIHLRAPDPAWGARVHAEVARRVRGESLGFAARLSWGWADFSLSAPRAGTAEFRLRTARLEGCARWEAAPFAIAPCLGVEGGLLSASAPDLPRAGHGDTRWTAASGSVRVGWSITEVLTLEFGLTLLVPFERTSFVLADPPRPVYTPPIALFEGGAGACVTGRFH